jgi:hypothetical protein
VSTTQYRCRVPAYFFFRFSSLFCFFISSWTKVLPLAAVLTAWYGPSTAMLRALIYIDVTVKIMEDVQFRVTKGGLKMPFSCNNKIIRKRACFIAL